MADTAQPDPTVLAVQLLSAYFSNNSVPSGDVVGMIETIRAALARKPAEPDVVAPEPEPEAVAFTPAVPVRKSLASRDHIISMIDGKPYKSLKRHLGAHDLTPDTYRERYGLAKDYPMVAPGYSEQRREVAKRLGLGRKPAATVVGTPAEAPAVEAVAAPKAAARKPRAKANTAVTPVKRKGATTKTVARRNASVPDAVEAAQGEAVPAE